MLYANNISFEYLDTLIFEQLNLTLLPGQILHIQGPNGSGKTTLLKIIAGVLSPCSGQLAISLPFKEAICFIGHKLGLSLELTVQQNCFLDPHWPDAGLDLYPLAAVVGLEKLLDKPCYQLSAGQKKRAALLRLFFTKSALWLLDEPFNALDAHFCEILAAHLKQHVMQGRGIIITAHQKLQAYFPQVIEFYL